MKYLRLFLMPGAILYEFIVGIRAIFYEKGWFPVKSYDFPVICVGNLSVGGTGKSPMVEYLLNLLKDEKQVAVLSRGYKRKTKGFKLLTGNENAAEVGDEPLQFKLKFPNVLVAVDENRRHGIEKLREGKNPPDVVLLDDAFQHRSVRAGLNILLTTFNAPFYKDFLLPAGDLRESRRGAKRADIIVVTKCPEKLSGKIRDEIRGKLKPRPYQQVFFSGISYSEEVKGKNTSKTILELGKFTLVTGIANPKPMINYLKNKKLDFEQLSFRDHHHFTSPEIRKLSQKTPILTTEKDYMRLKDFLPEEDLFFLPIKTKFLDNHSRFDKSILDFVSSN